MPRIAFAVLFLGLDCVGAAAWCAETSDDKLDTIVVTASADASAGGVQPAFAGGQGAGYLVLGTPRTFVVAGTVGF